MDFKATDSLFSCMFTVKAQGAVIPVPRNFRDIMACEVTSRLPSLLVTGAVFTNFLSQLWLIHLLNSFQNVDDVYLCGHMPIFKIYLFLNFYCQFWGWGKRLK